MFQMSWELQILLLIKDCVILHHSEYKFEVMQSFGAYKSFYVQMYYYASGKRKITNIETF